MHFLQGNFKIKTQINRTDAEAVAPILWPPLRKDPVAGKD